MNFNTNCSPSNGCMFLTLGWLNCLSWWFHSMWIYFSFLSGQEKIFQCLSCVRKCIFCPVSTLTRHSSLTFIVCFIISRWSLSLSTVSVYLFISASLSKSVEASRLLIVPIIVVCLLSLLLPSSCCFCYRSLNEDVLFLGKLTGPGRGMESTMIHHNSIHSHRTQCHKCHSIHSSIRIITST